METNKNTSQDQPMELSSHLKELRNRIIVVAIVFFVTLAVSLAFASQIVSALMAMGEESGYVFVFIAPQELISVYVQVALVSAIVISLPVIVYEIYQFAVPALVDKEKRAFKRAIFFGFIMFALGIAFAYYISLPFMLYFLINLGADIAIEASISIQSFVGFVLTIFVIFGTVFELPVVTSLLTMLGLLKTKYLVKVRKFAVVVIFLIAALITPPDIVSQVMVALPMILLYQVSIYLAKLIEKRKHVSEDDESDEAV